jgi:hypothetical protein
MSAKTLAEKATSAIGRKMLTVQYHSPTILMGVGAVGVVATTVLACRATLKLSDVLSKGEEHLSKIDEGTHEGIDNPDDETEKKTGKFTVRLLVATDIVKLYAPAIILGGLSIAAMTSSHVIMQKRNVGLAAAYAVVDRSFKEYRSRVVEDQGEQKDFEYFHGVANREIAEEGPNGIETKVIRGLDAHALKDRGTSMYSRIFDETNMNWSDVPHQNQMFLTSQMTYANMMLRKHGKVYLNDVYDMLGLERSEEGQVVGWVDNSSNGDGVIDFGVWNNGVYHGMEWVTGNSDAIMLDFNVEGVVLSLFKKR